MTSDDIIRMAREAGFGFPSNYVLTEPTNRLARFAKLVYEATFRDANIAASRTIIDAAVLTEREACAKVCESMRPSKPEFDQRYYQGCTDSAAAIRARGNP